MTKWFRGTDIWILIMICWLCGGIFGVRFLTLLVLLSVLTLYLTIRLGLALKGKRQLKAEEREKAVMFEYGIESIEFSGGENIPIEEASTLIIIGPNNCGKSTSLKEIVDLLSYRKAGTKVVVAIKEFLRGDAEHFEKWLEDHFPTVQIWEGKTAFTTRGEIILRSDINETLEKWEKMIVEQRIDYGDEKLFKFLFHSLDTATRTKLADPVESISLTSVPKQYIHILQRNESWLGLISQEVRKAFGKSLIINWAEGPLVSFHVGDDPKRDSNRDRVSKEYVQELNQLPTLKDEGDGIRSFVGIVLACFCDAQAVLLIDEPEAFLHPPQIQRLAGILAKNAEEKKRQVILATHSSEVVQGALKASNRVSICRITRDGNVNHVKQLSRSVIEQLWSKPLLRSAAAIDGVFHEGVVVCEADSDSRIYDALVERLDKHGELDRPPDLYFIQGGGKGELATIARAYMALGVKTAVIADFDVLEKRGEFEKLYVTLGGDFKEIERKHQQTVSALSALGPVLKLPDLIRQFERKIGELKVDSGDKLSMRDRRELIKLLENAADWSEAKKYGIEKLRGPNHQACQELLDSCKRVGLFIVPKGELESWWRGGAADKNEWFVKAIAEISSNSESFREANDFLIEVIKYLDT